MSPQIYHVIFNESDRIPACQQLREATLDWGDGAALLAKPGKFDPEARLFVEDDGDWQSVDGTRGAVHRFVFNLRPLDAPPEFDDAKMVCVFLRKVVH